MGMAPIPESGDTRRDAARAHAGGRRDRRRTRRLWVPGRRSARVQDRDRALAVAGMASRSTMIRATKAGPRRACSSANGAATSCTAATKRSAATTSSPTRRSRRAADTTHHARAGSACCCGTATITRTAANCSFRSMRDLPRTAGAARRRRQPERFVCFRFDGSRGLYIHPNIWHEGVFAYAGTQRFFDSQGAVHARVSVDFPREFGCLLEAPLR